MIVTINPNKQFPVSAPSAITDAIHDKSLSDILPDSSGVSSDRSNGSAIDNQPVVQPKPTIIKLASFFGNCFYFFSEYNLLFRFSF